jgi:predicted alpha/beta superfamily hydrolase
MLPDPYCISPRRFPQRSCLPTATADMSKRPAPSPAAFTPLLPRDADSYAGSFQLHINVASRHLTQKRHVIVYLPPGHGADPAVRYPVLYMHDGQNLFDGDTAYIRGHDWKMARTAERLMLEKKIEPLIIVGIWNTGIHRIDEYTPTRDPGVKQGGLLPLYGRFIVEELKPFMDATYCTDPARDRTGIGGSSLGGLAALLLGLHYSEYFGRIAALSPSLWWDHGVAFRLVRHLKRKPDVRIWLDMGTREMGGGIAQVRRMRDLLIEYGWLPDKDLFYREVRGGKHTEDDWGKRVGTVLRRLYPVKTSRTRKPRPTALAGS